MKSTVITHDNKFVLKPLICCQVLKAFIFKYSEMTLSNLTLEYMPHAMSNHFKLNYILIFFWSYQNVECLPLGSLCLICLNKTSARPY